MPDLVEWSVAARWWNTERPLTHSLDYGKEGLAMKATRVCSVPSCEGAHHAKGLCRPHYRRDRRFGAPIPELVDSQSASLPGEEWRPVAGYEGEYAVSDQGRVKSCARVIELADGRSRVHRERIRTAQVDRGGYETVSLWRRGRVASVKVHRLVAEAFCSNPDGSNVVRHLDGDPMNNLPANLMWGTTSENALDCVRHGTHPRARQTHCLRGHQLTMPNLATCKSETSTGHVRMCRACANARTWIWRNGGEMQEVADRYYSSIMTGAPKNG